jgi:hypothetical protein
MSILAHSLYREGLLVADSLLTSRTGCCYVPILRWEQRPCSHQWPRDLSSSSPQCELNATAKQLITSSQLVVLTDPESFTNGEAAVGARR